MSSSGEAFPSYTDQVQTAINNIVEMGEKIKHILPPGSAPKFSEVRLIAHANSVTRSLKRLEELTPSIEALHENTELTNRLAKAALRGSDVGSELTRLRGERDAALQERDAAFKERDAYKNKLEDAKAQINRLEGFQQTRVMHDSAVRSTASRNTSGSRRSSDDASVPPTERPAKLPRAVSFTGGVTTNFTDLTIDTPVPEIGRTSRSGTVVELGPPAPGRIKREPSITYSVTKSWCSICPPPESEYSSEKWIEFYDNYILLIQRYTTEDQARELALSAKNGAKECLIGRLRKTTAVKPNPFAGRHQCKHCKTNAKYPCLYVELLNEPVVLDSEDIQLYQAHVRP